MEADSQSVSGANGAFRQVLDAARYANFGYPTKARKAARAALALGLIDNAGGLAALALARTGDTRGAQNVAERLNREAPLDTLIQNHWLPAIRAEIEIQRGHAARAVELLQAALPYDATPNGSMLPTYTRGRAYLALGDGVAAAAEFQKILDHLPMLAFKVTGPLAYIGLARARAMQARSTQGNAAESSNAQARAAYEAFLTLWKDADSDIPLLREAKAEYAKLQ
jgi:predicted Zn-dependent protease